MNELQRYAATQIVRSDKSLAETASTGMLVAGSGGLILWGIAGLLPFISLPMLLVIMVLSGMALAFKD